MSGSSCHERVGRAATVVRCQGGNAKAAMPLYSKRALAMVGSAHSPATQTNRGPRSQGLPIRRSTMGKARAQRFGQSASPAVQSGWKAASKTAASVSARLNVSLAPLPRRSMCHTLANETPFHCNTTATQRVKTSAWNCLTGLPRADCSSADLADVQTWPTFMCWHRFDSTLPTKVF